MSQIDFLGAPIFQAFDVNGVPLAGGLLWSYNAGTDVPRALYGTINDASNQVTPLTNPVILDSQGMASIVFAGPTKVILEGPDIDPNTGHGSLIWTADGIGQFGNTVIDPDGNIIVGFDYQTNAVNYIEIVNSPSGNDPTIETLGADNNIGLTIKIKGTDALTVSNDVSSYAFPSQDGGNGDVLTNNGDGTSTWLPVPGVSGVIAPGITVSFAGNTAPTGWLICDGSAVSRATYANLFTAIGTLWGVGDGVNTFNLPNLSRCVTVGAGGTGTSTLGNAVGNVGGTETVALTTAQLASHTHTATTSSDGVHQHSITSFAATAATGNVAFGGLGSALTGSAGAHTHTVTVNSAGSGAAHNNIQPSAVMNAIIKV